MLRQRLILLLPMLVAVSGIARQAGGNITTFLVPVPISPEAIAADPALANYQTLDLRVDVPPGQRWGWSGFDATLTQGTFYNPPLGAIWPLPQTWTLFPHLRYDTFVTQAADPDDDSTFKLPQITSGFPSGANPVIFDDTRVSIVYGADSGPGIGPGVFTIARLTVTHDAFGPIVGVSAPRNEGPTIPFSLVIPEPGGAACVALTFALIPWIRRRSQRRKRAVLARHGPRGYRHVQMLLITMLVATTGLVRPAAANITTFVAPVPISPEAIAADPDLASYQTWDLRIDVPPGQPWGFSGFDATLTQGMFYNPPLGANWPLPQTWGQFPHLRFDTFVTQAADPDDDSTFIAPNVTSGFPEPPLPVIFDDTRISIVYHAQSGPGIGPGVFTIARLTFTHDSVGTIIGHSAPRTGGPAVPFAFVIPEPSGVAAALIVLVTTLLRRRGNRSMP